MSDSPLRVLLVDDEATARRRLERLLSKIEGVEIAGECESGEEALERLAEEDVDVLLLDIQMSGISGIETKELLSPDGPYVIFTTAHPEHALRAFDVGAPDYVLKPIDAARLEIAIERARKHLVRPRWTNEERLPRLAIETRAGVVLLSPSDVSHALFDGTLVTVHADREYVTALALTDLEKRCGGVLERVHRRALLNLAHVARLEPQVTGGYVAHLKSGGPVEVSRQAARKLRRRLGL